MATPCFLLPHRITRLASAAALIGLVGCDAASPGDSDTAPADPESAPAHQPEQEEAASPADEAAGPQADCATNDGEGSDLPCAEGISITQIDINQGVAVTLLDNGEWVPGNGLPQDDDLEDNRVASVVGNRPGIVVAAWDTDGDWSAREITARLVLSGGGVDEVYLDTKNVSGSSDNDMSNLDATFNWNVDAEHLVTGVKMTVDLREADSGEDGSDQANRFPDEPESLRIPDNPMTLEVTVVPITNTDPRCSGSTPPATDEPYLENYRKILQQFNPVSEVKIHAYDGPAVESNVDEECWFGTTETTGVLYHAYMARVDAEVHANHVYFAVADLCGDGGTNSNPCQSAGGMAWNWGFVAAAAWWDNGNLPDFYSWRYHQAVHEIGHAQGRAHSPGGGAGDPDPNYPNADGSLDTWGYGILDDSVHTGTGDKRFDYMSYEYSNSWSSLYTWEKNARYIAAYQNWDRGMFSDIELARHADFGNADKRAALRKTDTMLMGITQPDGGVVWRAIEGAYEPEASNSERTFQFKTRDGRSINSPAWETTMDGKDSLQYVVARMPEELQDISDIVDLGGGSRSASRLRVSVEDVHRYRPNR
ncbi:MAG: hypothetical protein B7733_24845 [Myxococcales bacterium FL481]|nr:MAG: hypothetical protein B7733_24845 [Myxococcales bacterium FL481]